MKTNKYLGIVIIIAMLLALVPVGSVSAKVVKIAVCHIDDMGMYHLINISKNAFPAHEAHGDKVPGDWIPGMTGYQFAADCTPVLAIDVSGYWAGFYGETGHVSYDCFMILAQASDGTVTGIWIYPNAAVRAITGTLTGNTLSIHMVDFPGYADYWADLSGTVTSTSYHGYGTDSRGDTVELIVDR